LFGVAAILICLLTAFLFGISTFDEAKVLDNLLGGCLGVFGVLSVPFLWGGMRRFQQMRSTIQPTHTGFIRLAMIVGFCYAAILYYLIVDLPERSRVLASSGWGSHISSTRR
jgi:hypothetical protein